MSEGKFNLEHSVIQLKTEMHFIREDIAELKAMMNELSATQRQFEWLIYGGAIAGLFSVVMVAWKS